MINVNYSLRRFIPNTHVIADNRIVVTMSKHVNVSNFEKEKIDIDPNFVEAVEILKKSGFINAEYTSKRR